MSHVSGLPTPTACSDRSTDPLSVPADPTAICRVAILGAQGTGKSWLAQALALSIGANPSGTATTTTVHQVNDVLRLWCEHEGRTPLAHEQEAIAQMQAHNAEHALANWVIADTTPLMAAVYNHLLFDDTRLYPMALAHHAIYAHTLVTGLDLPWVANSVEMYGPHTRSPIDTLLRQALETARLPYRVVYGRGPMRLSNALLAIGLPCVAQPVRTGRNEAQYSINRGRNAWQCNDCSDPDCERKLFTDMLRERASENDNNKI